MIPAVDLTLGDLLGSSLFNLLILAVLDLCTKTHGAAPKLASVASELADITGLGRTIVGTLFVALITSLPEAVTAAMVIFVTAVAIQGLLYRAEKRLWIVEPDAALLVVLVVAALSVVVWVGH